MRKTPKTTKANPDPYDRVEVIGESPLSFSDSSSTWDGVGARGVILKPLESFAGTVDRPYGELMRDYKTEFEPPNTIPQPKVEIIDVDALPSPEEVFAKQRK